MPDSEYLEHFTHLSSWSMMGYYHRKSCREGRYVRGRVQECDEERKRTEQRMIVWLLNVNMIIIKCEPSGLLGGLTFILRV